MLLSVLVPLYNEKDSLELCVQTISKYLQNRPFESELILIDDGSEDGTFALAERLAKETLGVRVLQHDTNRGKGAAIKTGAAAAKGHIIGFLDADLSTRPEAFDRALALLRDNDLVFASRSHPDSVISRRQPFFRMAAGKAFNVIIRRMTDLPYPDTQCGFKAFRRGLTEIATNVEADGWVFDVEFLVLAKSSGAKLAELPVVWRHDPTSRVRLRHAPAIYRELKRIQKRITLPPSMI